MDLGVDACRAGWVGVLLDDSTRARVTVAATFVELLTVASADVVAVDMPIGLPDTTRRQADVLARAELGPRRSSVFMTPTRTALDEPTHAKADAVNRIRAGEGISTQAFHLRPKLKEVEAVAFARAYQIVEAHPEVSFRQLAGEPLAWSKRTPAGMRIRRSLLRTAGIVLTRPDRVGPGVGPDDVLDAAAAAWSARRVRDGVARPIPNLPEVFSDGWPAAIWV